LTSKPVSGTFKNLLYYVENKGNAIGVTNIYGKKRKPN